jgi:hypothetical protein
MKDTERAVLINNDGKLLVSTDKRLVTEDASNLYPQDVLDSQTIIIKSDVAGKKLLVVPVMGLNARMGVIVISYNPPPLLTN